MRAVTVAVIAGAVLVAAAIVWLLVIHARCAAAAKCDPAMELCAALFGDASHICGSCCSGTLTLRPAFRTVRVRFVFFPAQGAETALSAAALFGADYRPRSLAFSRLPDGLRPDKRSGGLVLDYRLVCMITPHRRSAFLHELRARCIARYPQLSPTFVSGGLTAVFGEK